MHLTLHYIIELMSFAIEHNHFSSRHGSGVAISGNNTIATAVQTDYAMAYTALPIAIGQFFRLKCLQPGTIVSITSCTGLASKLEE
jgi:hypothetical protein